MSDAAKPSMWRRARSLARRYGLNARGAVVAVLTVMVVGGAAMGALGLADVGGMEIVRGEENEARTIGDASQDGNGGGSAAESATSTNAEEGLEKQRSAPIRRVVHVDGAVAAPGVYVLEEESPRVNDAVTRAGGLTSDADTTTVNLAAPVEDGQKVHIPVVGEELAQVTDGQGSAAQADYPATAGLVNINTATEAELCGLPGVGEVTAAAIVEEREANGAFASPEDIMRVSGIGEKKLAKLRELICV